MVQLLLFVFFLVVSVRLYADSAYAGTCFNFFH
jgi:hypothetical protein